MKKNRGEMIWSEQQMDASSGTRRLAGKPEDIEENFGNQFCAMVDRVLDTAPEAESPKKDR
jgi:hypothetical protein